jgi:alcohol dehydrogenase class IV
VIDAGKAIAALATNPGDPLDYLEVVGRNQPITVSPVPCIAIPTTAGTGSEVTRNAVLGVPEQQVKASLRSPMMLPRVAIVDPELTLDLPPDVTATTGMDALTQCIEPYVSVRANALTDLYCREGVRLARRSLLRACRNGADLEARTDMAYASLLGGLALANAGLGVVHGFAAPIGGMFSAPHGGVCAALLPHGVAGNIAALRSRHPDHPALGRYREIASALTGNPAAEAEDAAVWVRELCDALRIRSLREYGIAAEHTAELVNKAANASSMKANPIVLTDGELRSVLHSAL